MSESVDSASPLDITVRRHRLKQFERTDDSFLGLYKQHDIRIEREPGQNWYIAVQSPCGLYDYDGYWIDSQCKSIDDAIVEACTGAQLWTTNVTKITGLGIGQARNGETKMTDQTKKNSADSTQVRVDCALEAWQPIDTAPKGGGAECITDPNWVEPPLLLLFFADGNQAVCHWDWYYAPGGKGYRCGISAWIEPVSGEQIALYHDEPTHWMPRPTPPV